ncbi:MAG: hypothetical protein QM736_11340 [Vicinamibacterales bacterium]
MLPSHTDVDAAIASLGAARYPIERDENGIGARDPWGTRVLLSAAS